MVEGFSGYANAGGILKSLGNGTKLNPLRKSLDREWPSQEQSSIQSTSTDRDLKRNKALLNAGLLLYVFIFILLHKIKDIVSENLS